MGTEENKKYRKVNNMIKERYYAVNYIEGYIDALFDWDLINDSEFANLNDKLLKVRR